MTLVPYNEVASTPAGAKARDAKLYVYETGTDTEVQLFRDADGLVQLVQPLRSDTEGRFTRDSASHTFISFYLAGGQIVDEYLLDSRGVPDALNPRVPVFIPAFPIAGAETFKGGWDASTNTPELVDGTGTAGDVYRVSKSGTGTGLSEEPSGGFVEDDEVVYDGSVWLVFPAGEAEGHFEGGGLYTDPPPYGPVFDGEIALGGNPEPNDLQTSARHMLARLGLYVWPRTPEAGDQSSRMAGAAALRIVEAIDPAELRVARSVAEHNFFRTGKAGTFRRRYPAGWSTRLAFPAAGGATTIYIDNGRHFPTQVQDATRPSGVTFEVDGQPINYTTLQAIGLLAAQDYPVGTTAIAIADASVIPSGPGGALANGTYIRWESSTHAAMVLSSNEPAGSVTIPVTGDPAVLSALPAAGVIAVVCNGPVTRYVRYTSVAVAGGAATFTLDPSTPIDIAATSGAVVSMDTLNDVTGEFESWIVGADRQDAHPNWRGVLAGATELKVELGQIAMTNPEHAAHLTAWGNLPSSGTLTIESEVRPSARSGLVDRPWRRIAYTAKSSDGVLTLAAPLPFNVEDKAWIRVEGHPGLARSSSNQLVVHKLTGVTGLGSSAARGSVVAFNPRHSGWSPAQAAAGFFAADVQSAAGLAAWVGHMYFKSLRDTPSEDSVRGQAVIVASDEHSGRQDVLYVTPMRAGVFGRGIDVQEPPYKWAVGGPQARVLVPPGLDPVARSLAVRSLTEATWPSSTYFPNARRLDVFIRNNAALADDRRDIDYGDLDLVAQKFTGLSFNQVASGPKTTLAGDQAVPAATLTVVTTAPGLLPAPHNTFFSKGKIRARSGRLILGRFLHTGKTATTFTGVSAGAAIGFLSTLNALTAASHYRFEDASGAVLAARVGVNGSIAGAPDYAAAGALATDSDTALWLNHSHTGDSVLIPTLPGSYQQTAILIAGKWSSGPTLMCDNTNTPHPWSFFDHAGTFAVNVAGTTLDTSLATSAVRDGNQHVIVLSKDADAVTVWVDGVIAATGTGFADTAPDVHGWMIGRNGGDPTASEVIIDEAAFFAGPLIDAEAVALTTTILTGPLGGSGTLLDGTIIEEDYGLSDFYVPDSSLGISKRVAYPVSAAMGTFAAEAGRDSQVLVGAVGPNGEAGIDFG